MKRSRLALIAVLAVLTPPAASLLRLREGMGRYGDQPLPEIAAPLPTIVLGMGGPALLDRVDRALDLWRAGHVSMFFVSGGQGKDEVETEAATMARALREGGVPDERITEEGASTSTWENLTNCRGLVLAARGADAAEASGEDAPPPLEVYVVTHAYHAQRTFEMATALGYRPNVVATSGSRLDRRAYRLGRETLSYMLWRARRALSSDGDSGATP